MARMAGSKGTAGGMRLGLALTWVLRALAAGRSARRDASGCWRLGGRPVPPGVLEQLVRDELAIIGDEEARATELGMAHVERLEAPQRPNRWLERAGRVGREPVLRDRLESPLAWLARRRLISGTQLAAGERLRCDWQLAHALPSVTMRWDPVALRPGTPWSGPAEPGPAMLDARRRLEQALAAVGPGLATVLERVVCAGEGLSVAERAMGWPARAGKVVLGLALDRLAAHYGLDSGQPPAGAGRLPGRRTAGQAEEARQQGLGGSGEPEPSQRRPRSGRDGAGSAPGQGEITQTGETGSLGRDHGPGGAPRRDDGPGGAGQGGCRPADAPSAIAGRGACTAAGRASRKAVFPRR